MGFLNQIFKRGSQKKKQAEVPAENSGAQGKSLEDIWAIEDETDCVLALAAYIGEKCKYGDAMETLSAPERIFYMTQSLEMEVNNGGFDQYFFNSSGDFANELVNAFTEIGAIKTAEICKKAVSIFGEEVPADRYVREDMILDHEEYEEILNECDNAFYEYPDDLIALNYGYVRKNKASFT